MRSVIIAFMSLPGIAFGDIQCADVPVSTISSTSSSSFHGMHEGGAEGAYLYLHVSKSSCVATNGEDLASGVYMVIDQIGHSDDPMSEIKRYWLSSLVSAKYSHTKISFSGKAGGINRHNRQVVEPTTISMSK